VFDPENLKLRLSQIEEELQKNQDWDSPTIKAILKERANILERLSVLETLEKEFKNLCEWYELFKEEKSLELLQVFLEEA